MCGLIWKLIDALEILSDSDIFLGVFLVTWLSLVVAFVQALWRRR